MTTTISRLICSLALCHVLFISLHSRADGQNAEQGSHVFQVFLVDDIDYSNSRLSRPATELKFENRGEVFTIQAHSHGMSSLFSYEGSPRLVFFKEVAGDNGEIVRQPLTTVDLGEPGRRILFIRKAGNGRLYSSVIKIDPEFFKKDHLRIQNLSNHVVRARVSDGIETLQSLEGHDFKVDVEDGPPVVELLMAGHDGKEAYVIEKKHYVFRRGNRKMILLYNDRNKDMRVRYSSIFVRKAPEAVVNVSDEKEEQQDISGYYTAGGLGQGSEPAGPDGP